MARPKTTVVIAGSRHGHLVVVREIEKGPRGHTRVECRCDCGKVVQLRAAHLYSTRRHCSQQCKFLSGQRVVDLTGKRIGRWTVVSSAGTNRSALWNCRCDCGTEKTLRGALLNSGGSKSCGCLIVDMLRKDRTPEEALAARRDISRRSANKHSARRKAQKIKYETKRTHATPPWLTKEHWEEMDAFYSKARCLTKETGVRHEVDHIYPLNGEFVSGLHIPRNLQILTQAENVSKSNRYAELSGD